MAVSEAAYSSTSNSTAYSSLITSLLNTIGVEIFTHFLHPKDLLSLGLTSHQLRDTVLQPNALLTSSCIHPYLPLQLGVTTNYLAELIDSHSYSSKSQLVDHLLDRLHTSHLRFKDTISLQDSQLKARHLFLNQDKSLALFHSINTNDDDSHNNNRQISTAVECHYQANATKSNAIAWIDYILNRDACQRYGTDGMRNRLIRDWLLLLLSSIQHSEDATTTTIQVWRWGCKHSNLSGRGISGVGVMISTTLNSAVVGQQHYARRRQEIELRLTRLY